MTQFSPDIVEKLILAWKTPFKERYRGLFIQAANEIERLRASQPAAPAMAQPSEGERCSAATATPSSVSEDELTEFLCDEQDRLGPGCDERALAHTLLRAYVIKAPGDAAQPSPDTCGICMGSGYSNHPDSGEICQACKGQGVSISSTVLDTGTPTHPSQHRAQPVSTPGDPS